MARMVQGPHLMVVAALALLLLNASASRAEGLEEVRATTAVDELRPVPVPEPSALAVRYHRSGNWLWGVEQLWAFAVQAVLLFSGLSARLRDVARRIGRVWFFTIGIYCLLYGAIVFVLDLPLEYYHDYIRQHSYGLSNQSLGRWFGNALKELAVGMIGGFLFLWVPYLLLARSPRRWWLYATLLSLPFSFLVMLIAPIWIDPLFNDFGPMKDPALERKILALAERARISGSHIYEVNKSLDSKALNAYVKGFLSTKRIVLYDTLLTRLEDREILAVMGHEMGHYALGHVTRSILLSSLVVLVSLFLVDRAGRWLIARFAGRFRFDRLSDVASLPLILLLLQASSLLLAPVVLAYSRAQELEADRFALEMTRTNRSAAQAFAKLQQENLGVPWQSTFEKIWRATHPSIGERIEYCNQYHPWTQGRSLSYGAYFQP
jgi:Zn-dependent protease with chaperone function